MKTQGRMWIVGACLASLLLLVVCETAAGRPPGRGPVFRPGPPAHAPAYGRRRQQVCGLEIAFDAGLGLYIVVGRTDVWYHEGHFYRLRAGVWETSLHADIWGPVVIEKLPPGLQVKAKALAKPNGNASPGDKGNGAVKSNAADNKAGANPGGNANNGAKTNAGDNKGNGGSAGAGDKVAKPNADANSGKAAKPATDASTGKPASKPDNGGKARPAGKGRK